MHDMEYSRNPIRFTQEDMDDFLKWCSENRVSDITIKTGHPIIVRHHGLLKNITKRSLSHAEVGEILNVMFGANGTAQVMSAKDLDFSYDIKRDRFSRLRYRCNATACMHEGGIGIEISIRTITSTPPLISDLNIEPEIIEAMTRHQGMNLIVGETGSGKSTLMASIIRNMIEDDGANIKVLTYEAPIEYVYDEVKKTSAIVTQTEIPKHLPSFEAGIRNAMRRDPDVILVGESRDAQTMSAAVEAARTGHLLFTTLHSNSVSTTIRRIANMFPEGDRQARVLDIIETVNIIITQRLLPSVKGGQIAIREYLVWTDGIKDILYNSDINSIPAVVRDLTRKYGKTLEFSAREKYNQGLISEKEYRKIVEMDKRQIGDVA